MSRAYNVRITALITGASAKWLDNLMSRHHLVGVERQRQGIERRISDDGLLAIELCRILNVELGVSLRRAVAIANDCMRSSDVAQLRHTTSSGLTLQLPVASTRARLRDRTMEAVEMVATARRGRPALERR